jgi:hypothetical protein
MARSGFSAQSHPVQDFRSASCSGEIRFGRMGIGSF